MGTTPTRSLVAKCDRASVSVDLYFVQRMISREYSKGNAHFLRSLGLWPSSNPHRRELSSRVAPQMLRRDGRDRR